MVSDLVCFDLQDFLFFFSNGGHGWNWEQTARGWQKNIEKERVITKENGFFFISWD